MTGSGVVARLVLVAVLVFISLASTGDWVPVQRQAARALPVVLHHEQTVAVVVLDSNLVVTRCSLLLAEQQDGMDKRELLTRLGQKLEVREVDFTTMVDLVEACKTEGARLEREPDGPEPEVNFWTVKSGIMPGTLWCGVNDIAENYKNLGESWQVDTCCRAHDHCPVKVKPLQNRYGLRNFSPSTKSHCMCDQLFLSCLRNIKSKKADSVGKIFFNLLAMKCMEKRTTKRCLRHQTQGGERRLESERRQNSTISKRRKRFVLPNLLPNIGLSVAARGNQEVKCLEWGEEEKFEIVDTKEHY